MSQQLIRIRFGNSGASQLAVVLGTSKDGRIRVRKWRACSRRITGPRLIMPSEVLQASVTHGLDAERFAAALNIEAWGGAGALERHRIPEVRSGPKVEGGAASAPGVRRGGLTNA